MPNSDTVMLTGTAIVTGGGSGIGRATGLALARAGMQVLMAGRRRNMLEAVVAQQPGLTAMPCDITVEEDVDALARQAMGGLDILVHSAAVYSTSGFSTWPGPAWDATLDSNLRAPLRISAACLPGLQRRGGLVVFVNSTAGLGGTRAPGLYAMTKAGLRAAVDAFRQEVNPLGIRVLSIYPGRTDTPMQQEVLAAENRDASSVSMLQAEDVAAMILATATLPRSAEVTEITIRPASSPKQAGR